MSERSPLLPEEGWTRHQEDGAKAPSWSGRARSASATARSLKKGHSRKLFPRLTTPSAPLRRLRDFFLLAQTPLLTEEGTCALT